MDGIRFENPPKKKILLVTTTDGMAGAEKNIYDLTRLIDRTLYELKLVVFKHEQNGELIDKVRAIGVPAECLGIQSKFQSFKLFKLWRIVSRFRPDILESFLYFDNQACRLVGKAANIPIIISGLQNIETRQGAFRKFVDRLTVRCVDAVISNSDAGKDLYVRRNYLSPEKIFIAKSGIDVEQLRELQSRHTRDSHYRSAFGISIPEDHYALLTVGFLTEQKGTVYLLQAMRLLREDGYKVVCFIAGQGDLRKILEQEAIRLGTSETVYFLGYVVSSYQYLQLFDLFVLPSLWEGLPNVVIEAMASRVPVVATNVGGVHELITDGVTGFLCPPTDANALAKKIEQAIDLPADARAHILDAAYEHINRSFTTDSMVAAYVACYEQLGQRKKR